MSDPRGNNYDRRRALQTTPQLQGGNTGALANPPPVMTAPDTVAQQPTPQPGPMPAQPTMNPMEAIAMALGAADPRFEGVGQMAALGNRMRQQQYQMDMAERTARFNEEFKREELKLKRQQALTPALRNYQYEMEVGTLPRDAAGNPIGLLEYEMRSKAAGAARTDISVGGGVAESEYAKKSAGKLIDLGTAIDSTMTVIDDAKMLRQSLEAGKDVTGFAPQAIAAFAPNSAWVDLLANEFLPGESELARPLRRLQFADSIKALEAYEGAISEGEKRSAESAARVNYGSNEAVRSHIPRVLRKQIRQLERAEKWAKGANQQDLADEYRAAINEYEDEILNWKELVLPSEAGTMPPGTTSPGATVPGTPPGVDPILDQIRAENAAAGAPAITEDMPAQERQWRDEWSTWGQSLNPDGTPMIESVGEAE